MSDTSPKFRDESGRGSASAILAVLAPSDLGVGGPPSARASKRPSEDTGNRELSSMRVVDRHGLARNGYGHIKGNVNDHCQG